MHRFYEKLIDKDKFKGGIEYSIIDCYPTSLKSNDEDIPDPVAIAETYDELIEKRPDIAEDMIWTQVEVDGEKIMQTIKEWKKKKLSHGSWYPRHVFFGVDPGFTVEKADKLAKE